MGDSVIIDLLSLIHKSRWAVDLILYHSIKHQTQLRLYLTNMDKSAPVAILGGGAWGLSTALHLVEAGHTNITVFERDERIPSQYSAAADLNKIIRAEYEDGFYTDLVLVSWTSNLGYVPY